MSALGDVTLGFKSILCDCWLEVSTLLQGLRFDPTVEVLVQVVMILDTRQHNSMPELYLLNITHCKGDSAIQRTLPAIVHHRGDSDEDMQDDVEGPTLANCEFSLAYGGKILLNNARLILKRGRRYGLCGANGEQGPLQHAYWGCG
jgi:hypothetical protein